MLTQHDLKQIENIVGRVIDRKLEDKLDQKLKPIRRDIKTIISFFDSEVIDIRKRVDRIERHLELTN